ncbi:MAG: amidohydrolase family protein, partial [bacterium]
MTAQSDLLVTNTAVFDGENAELVDGPVAVHDGRIVAVGAAAERGTDVVVVDARGGTVLPGLIDAHCHPYGISLDMVDIEASPLSYIALVAAGRLRNALHRGFTTIRDVAGGDAG